VLLHAGCFRDWRAEATAHPREVAEQALAHALPDKVEAAYRRGAMLEKRRRLMQEWATFCEKLPAGGEVVPFGQQLAADRGRRSSKPRCPGCCRASGRA
jgi:hypothetical protein